MIRRVRDVYRSRVILLCHQKEIHIESANLQLQKYCVLPQEAAPEHGHREGDCYDSPETSQVGRERVLVSIEVVYELTS